ncbi:alpha-amylase family glycosyl hydrolase [Asticcacaulis sp. SL142]|uniref:alpha-amylase family glycosyl hydrolase n=1 Tax=Asticcacaulis sp. SL142 TaxID=2995155 RepID=UPI00226CE6FC|nr:alpha-amylase family glycosyl hydrolase [Asticcacaulis sp. SL142]WAC48256.1 alpha-amylase family glycosyl hydrolase [Asticcacaulis sp. SL142]
MMRTAQFKKIMTKDAVQFPGLPPQSESYWRQAAEALTRLYGGHSNFPHLLNEIGSRTLAALQARPDELKCLDQQRPPNWYLKSGRPAYCAYIDRFGGTLAGSAARLDYLQALNVGIFHPLPLLKPREGDSDGGFAVADYRDVDPRLGSFDDLKDFATALRQRDMSLVLDMVLNHTAKEHGWAQRQLAGDPQFEDFYIVVKSKTEVDAWEENLQDVFPDTAPGNFTLDERAGGYVWTTFYPFQWDLNYANPQVFIQMMDCLLHLANAGVEGFRLDSTAYLWKRLGTASRNLPETHDILRAFRALLSIVAPSVFLLAEAIESQASVLPFFGTPEDRECDLAYNNGVMTALWGALADQKVDVLTKVITTAAEKPDHGQWLNYVRCHDDIIWHALSDSAPKERLQHWSDFFAGKDSYAQGMAFQAPPGFPASGCGMAASLCGGRDDAMAIDRLKLLYGVTYALEGVPLLYMGDEIALENFEDFRNDPTLKDEMRWLHRPKMDWNKAAARSDLATPQGEMYTFLAELAQGLAILPFAAGMRVMDTEHPSLLHIERPLETGRFVCVANFSPRPVTFTAPGTLIIGNEGTALAPYAVNWYVAGV